MLSCPLKLGMVMGLDLVTDLCAEVRHASSWQKPCSWGGLASSTLCQEDWWALDGRAGQLGCLTRAIWSRGPANCRWTRNMSKKQTFVFFKPEVGKLSWPENEYFRLAAAAELCRRS